MSHLAWRLAIIVGSAVIRAQIAQHWRSNIQPVLPDRVAAARVAVVGLPIVGLATMSGIRTH